jgi:hypothetical protein
MTEEERRAMAAGWFLGQILGRIQIPEPPFSEPVRIYDPANRQWLAFPSPLLTPQSEFRAPYDWLPAVLEGSLLAIAQSHEPPVMRSLRPYSLLREIFDAHTQGPASGIVERSADMLARQFLQSGPEPGLTPRDAAIAAAATPEERLAAVEDWLGKVRSTAAQLLPADAPGVVPSAFTTIANRTTAAKTPYFRDLAPDVFWAADTLINLLQRQASALASGELAASNFFDGGDVAIPEGGTF